MATLEVLSDTDGSQFFELNADEMIVGRDQFCDIVLRKHTVSRQHARIVRAGDGYAIEDLSSLNGTYVNGRRVEGRIAVKDKDRIQIYEVMAVFHEGTLEAVKAAAALAASSGEALEGDTLVDVTLAAPEAAARVVATQGAAMQGQADATSQARFRAALKVSLQLEGSPGIDQLLPKILDSLFEIFPQAVRGYVLLAEGANGHLVPRALKHRQSEAGHSMTFGPISRQTASHVMNTAQALLMADSQDDAAAEANQSVLDVHCLSMICAPLMGPSRRPMGILYLDATDPKRRFQQEDLDVLVAVATIAGQEVESAGGRQGEGGYAGALGTAKQVQMQFLPQRRPEVPGYAFFDHYQPADEVGGDYFGYIPLPDGRLALAIGDVAGKGVSAALLMAHFCAEVRNCLATSATPAEAVGHLNQDLSSEMLNYHFVTFLLCVLDPRAHRMTIVNAGHLPPLRRQGRIVEELGSSEGGLPLGCDAARDYRQLELPLEPGDMILLYTDGISEAMNARDEVYGTPRLRDALVHASSGVERVGRALLDDVRRFVGGTPQSDDICMVCLARDE